MTGILYFLVSESAISRSAPWPRTIVGGAPMIITTSAPSSASRATFLSATVKASCSSFSFPARMPA
ncbi:MAG: hypothetical protein HYU46_08955 [Deltaproteobacteria bacterium]|nr:hypothetical protein [Deltaproteobacteria bacterium]